MIALASLLIVIAVLLIALEVKTFLSHGVLGVVGAALGYWGVVLATDSADGAVVAVIVAASLVASVFLVIVMLRSSWVNGLVLQQATTGQPSELAARPEAWIGRRGVATTDLRPAGVGRFENAGGGHDREDVLAEDGAYIDARTPILVVRVAQNSLVVRRDESSGSTQTDLPQ